MTPREKAEELIAQFKMILMNEDTECGNEILCTLIAKECAKLSVRQILSSNPHSNPFNTEPQSTFDYWYEIYNLLSE
jgi:hypothetical protein